MILYPLFSAIFFKVWSALAPKNSWIKRVQSDNSWKSTAPIKGKVIWMHCASLGEFEMGRPVLEMFLDKHTDWKAVVTFFSPSGYEPRKKYSRAKVHYLPIDTKSEAKAWLKYCNPNLAVIVRNDVWPNHLNALGKKGIPLVTTAMSYTKTPWYLSRWLLLVRREMVAAVHTWGVVNEKDAATFSRSGIHTTILGNPKYDYAAELLGKPADKKFVAWKKAQNKPIILIGSAHIEDCVSLDQLDISAFSLWVVPHHLEDFKRQQQSLTQFKSSQTSNSSIDKPRATDLLMVTEFGVLAGLYALADGVVIGGGWGKATHNALEATAQGKIAACGPHWDSIPENHDLVAQGFLYPTETHVDMTAYLNRIGSDSMIEQGKLAQEWMLEQSGAAEKIVKVLEQAVQL